MPTLFKRPNGIYYIAYGTRGKRKWKSTGERTKTAAQRQLVAFLTNPEPVPSARKATRLQAFRDEFLKYAETSYAPGTVLVYKTAFKHLLSHFGDKDISQVQTRDVDLFRIERLKKVSPVTVNIELRMLRAAFYTALRWELIEVNPFRRVRMARVPEQQPVYFSKKEFQDICSRISETWLKDLVIVAALTGLRRGELVNLTWDRVDFQRRTIDIESNGAFQTKTGKKRVVPMNNMVSTLLRKRQAVGSCHYVFSTRGRKVNESVVTHRFKAYVRTTGVNPRLHFHSLRHTFASWLVQDGVSLYEVQKLMGHSNISVTQVYSHLQPEHLHKTVNRIQLADLI